MEKSKHENWGGARPGSGPAPIYPEGRMVTVGVRMTPTQKETFLALGGTR